MTRHTDLEIEAALEHCNPNLKTLGRERLKSRDFLGFLFLFSSEQRLDAFRRLVWSRMTGVEYWQCVREVWESAEFIAPHFLDWQRILTSRKANKEVMMNKRERATLAKLPEVLTIYRGCGHPKGIKSFSWTLDKSRANFFSEYACGSRRKFHGMSESVPTIATAQCKKRDVIAYLNGRQEREVIVNPFKVKILTVT